MLEMLDDDFFELDEDLLNASDNLIRTDENIGKNVFFLFCFKKKKLSLNCFA